MGTRWILEVTCPQCGFEDDDVYFAPTCGFVDWKCPQCSRVVDLYALTGITYEDASNAAEIKELCSRFGSADEILKGGCPFDLTVYSGRCPAGKEECHFEIVPHYGECSSIERDNDDKTE